jgi:hypothetical protein
VDSVPASFIEGYLNHFTSVCGVQYAPQLYRKLQVCIRKYFNSIFTFCDICLKAGQNTPRVVVPIEEEEEDICLNFK